MNNLDLTGPMKWFLFLCEMNDILDEICKLSEENEVVGKGQYKNAREN